MTMFFRYALAVFLHWGPLTLIVSGQNSSSASLQNKALMDGQQGEVLLLNAREGDSLVLIRWQRGYVAYGLLHQQKPEGYWYLYDGHARLRKTIFFTAGIAAMAEVFDRKGKSVVKTNYALPW